MPESEESRVVRFGRTVVQVVAGELVEQPVQAIITAANSRGLMGAGPAGSLRSAAGPEIEREAMSAAPFDLGTAFVTSSGKLADRGILGIVHAVVAERLGDFAEPDDVRRAVAAALTEANNRRYRTVALPLIGSRADAPQPERLETVDLLLDDVISHIRVARTRIETVTIVSRFSDDLKAISEHMHRARQRSWPETA
jgi:O-acetyl-ADP-ribose deacetylase (regulator of RNase III)